MTIDISNKTKKRIQEEFVNKTVRKALLVSGKKLKSVSLSVVFVGSSEIRALNRMHRKKDERTDILSYNFLSGYNKNKGSEINGEIVLSPRMIEESAKKQKIGFERELAFVLAHGIFHLLGMRHSKKMYALQDKVCDL